MSSVDQTTRLVGVQYLRALAALMVAYFHVLIQIPAFDSALSLHRFVTTDRLYNGVSVFFVISGFIMYVTGASSSPGQFAMRRLVRIVPLYWLLTLGLFFGALALPQLFRSTVASAEYLAKSLLFIPYFNPGEGGRLYPLLVPGWTLNCEMFFYGVFMLALFAPPRWRMPMNVFILGTLVLMGMLSPHSKLRSYYGFYTNVMLSQFAIGIVIGYLYKANRLKLSRFVCFALMTIGLIFLFCPLGGVLNPDAADTAGASALVLGTVALDNAWARWSVPIQLGDASYSIYLTHLFTLGATRALWTHLHLGGAALYAVISMTCVCLVSVLVYRTVERPILRATRRWTSPTRPWVPVASVSAAPGS